MKQNPSIADRIDQLSATQRKWLANQLIASLVRENDPTRTELVAWVVAESESISDQELRREMNDQLPTAFVPRRLVRIDSIPRTSTGKVDRHRLATMNVAETRVASSDQGHWSESERALIRICRSLLRVQTVSPQDNFFHIGGDSLLSIRLISMARDQGLAIEPRDVLECTSIAELAAAADRRSDNDARVSETQQMTPVISKVRSGRQAGSILLVHEVGGRCHYAHYLAADLAPGRTLYVSSQPPRGDEPQSIEGLANLYIDAWVSAEPGGPRILVCFCWGGLLGYEIAKQLKQRGLDVSSLLIVESGTEAAYDHASGFHRQFDRMKGNLIRVRNRVRSLRSREAFGQLIKTLTAKMLNQRSATITADAGFQFRDDEGDPEQIRSNVQAFLDYAIQPEALPLHLFRVTGPAGLIGTRYSDRSLGWRYVVGKHLTLHLIPGTHDTCMQPPHVGKLAAAMNRVIDRKSAFSRT